MRSFLRRLLRIGNSVTQTDTIRQHFPVPETSTVQFSNIELAFK